MFAKIVSLSKQTLIYGFSYILSRFFAFLLMPFYTHLISPSEFAAYSLIYMFISILQVLYVGGLDIAFLKNYVAEETSHQKKVFSTSFIGMLVIGTVLTIVFMLFPLQTASFIFKNPPDSSALWVRLSALILLVDSLNTIPLFKLRGDKKPIAFAVVTILKVLCNIAANIWLVGHLRTGMTGILYSNLISSTFAMLILIPVFFDKFTMKLDLAILKKLWKFGLPNVPALEMLFIIEFAGRKIMELTRSMEEVGLYSAGHRLGMFMLIVTNAFRFAWQPFFLAEAKNKDAPQTFARVFTYFTAVSGSLFLIFVMFAVDLVKMKFPGTNTAIIDETYWVGLKVFPFILMSHFFDGIYANFSVGVYLKNKTKLIPLIMGITLVFNLTGNILLIPRFGMMGAAWVNLLSYAVMAFTQYQLIHKHYPVPYEWSRVLRFTIPAAFAAAAFFIWNGPIWWRLFLLLIVPVIMYFDGFLTPSEKYRIDKLFKRLRISHT